MGGLGLSGARMRLDTHCFPLTSLAKDGDMGDTLSHAQAHMQGHTHMDTHARVHTHAHTHARGCVPLLLAS